MDQVLATHAVWQRENPWLLMLHEEQEREELDAKLIKKLLTAMIKAHTSSDLMVVVSSRVLETAELSPEKLEVVQTEIKTFIHNHNVQQEEKKELKR